jgi:hypothetical protein
MLSPRLTNCKGCADIPDLLRRIDCKLAELGNNLYNNVVFMLNKPIAVTQISELLVYKRVLMFRYCDTHYATRCPEISTEDIASKVIRLTAGYVSFCNEPTVCEITTCAITPCPNPTTTTTSTSSTSTTSTTSTSSTTTSTTTLNCNFTGVIDCSITTTTTTTPPPTTTTTTSYFPDAFGVPCLWSTDGGNPGSVAVYDFDTNTSTTVLVPNDFTETVGIERPICATEDKLWLSSIVNQRAGSGSSGMLNHVYIREWDIDATGALPILTYVREITVRIGEVYSVNLSGTSVWAMTAKDNDTLIIGTGYEFAPPPQEGTGGLGRIYLNEFSIAAAGDISIFGTDISNEWAGSPGIGNANKLSNITYTNSGQLVMGYRLDLKPDGSGFAGLVGNYLKVFPVTPSSPEFENYNTAIASRNLQLTGIPDFSESYNGPKDVPFWGVNGVAQLLQPETLEVYTLDQLPPYNFTLANSVTSSNDWLSSATHCSNIEFETADTPDCGVAYFPPFFFDSEGNPARPSVGGVYDPTPQTFTYQGMTCTASIAENVDAFDRVDPFGIVSGHLGQSGSSASLTSPCSGLLRPSSEGQAVTLLVSGDNFSITINFPVPVNNIAIRAGVLNSNVDGTDGDVYYVETNGGTPTLSINQGCYVQVDSNRLWGGVQNPFVPSQEPIYNEGDGEFKVTAPANYTSMTIYGNAPSGGDLFLGCPSPALNCNRIYTTLDTYDCNDNPGICAPQNNFPDASDAIYRVFQSHNIVTGTLEPIVLPPGSAFTVPNSCVSENYMAWTISVDDDQNISTYRFARLQYTPSASGVPENLSWDGIIYELDPNDLPDPFGTVRFPGGMSTINDNTFVLNYRLAGGAGKRVFEASFVPGSNVLAVSLQFTIPEPFNGGSEHVVTLNEDGTPSKYIALRSNEPIVVSQFDYATGNFEGDTMLSGPGLVPDSYRTSGDMCVIGEFLYITARRLDTNTTELWKVSFNTLEWSIAESDNSYNGGSSGSKPSCRISDGFNFSNTTTTTTTQPGQTTTTTTTVTPGVRTIFTTFSVKINPS